MKRLLAYFQLLRLPNVFTAMADVFMGFLVSHGSLRPWKEFVPLLVASSCLYLSGMVLNDWFDIEVDRVERPERPLPSGRIPRSHALLLGIVLVLAGVGIAFCVGSTSRNVALPLAACVLLYDGLLKDSLVGPAIMGLCRALNVLLGMSSLPGSIWLFQQNLPQAWRFGTVAAAGVGLYIMSVTRLARSEAGSNATAQPLSSTLGMNLGLLLIAMIA
ncbi:MAG: UbiA family prenyltransferase, partial [Planctomycetes bacterium]|nr:UbiA family prenyltransferase [Planctomycetota bacterium]